MADISFSFVHDNESTVINYVAFYLSQGAQGEPGSKGERGDPGLPVCIYNLCNIQVLCIAL
jgi:hypothetical protein